MELVKLRDYEIEETKLSTLNLQPKDQSPASSVREPVRRELSRSDLPGLRHETKDVLQQLQANISHLEDLGGRLSFSLLEVRSLIRR